MKSIKIISIIIMLLASYVLAYDDVPMYLQHTPGQADFPDQDALLLKNEIIITLGADGIITRHYLSVMKVLGDYVLQHRQADPKIAYNDETETLRIIQARTYMQDGKAVDATPNALNEIVPFELEYAPDYMNFRQMIVTHLGVELFATMVLEYEIKDKKPLPRPFWGKIDLETDKPILSQKISIQVPVDKTLSFAATEMTIEPQIEDTGDYKIYHFIQENVPAVNLDENDTDINQLIYSTTETWEQVAHFFDKQLENAVTTSTAIQQRVDSLVNGVNEMPSKIAKIHHDVVEYIKNIDWPVAAFNFQPRPAEIVYNSAYGHPLDKAVLLVTMLQQAGITANIIFASTSDHPISSVPTLVQFDDIWVQAISGSDSLWLDPTTSLYERNYYALEGKSIFNAKENDLPVMIPVSPAIQNRMQMTGIIQLALRADELILSGQTDIELTGRYNPHNNPAFSVDKLVSDYISIFAGAVKDDKEIATPSFSGCTLNLKFKEGKLKPHNKRTYRWSIPRHPQSLIMQDVSLHRTSRTTRLYLQAPLTEKVKYQIKLPDKVKMNYLPAELHIVNTIGEYHWKVKQQKNKINIESEFIINKRVIEPEEYPIFRKFMLEIMLQKNNVMLFQKDEKS